MEKPSSTFKSKLMSDNLYDYDNYDHPFVDDPQEDNDIVSKIIGYNKQYRESLKRYTSVFEEGVLDYKHTPPNISSIYDKNKDKYPQRLNTPAQGVNDADYLRKHGVKIPKQPSLITKAPPSQRDIEDEQENEKRYQRKFGPVNYSDKNNNEKIIDVDDEDMEDEDDFIVIGDHDYGKEDDKDSELNDPENFDFFHHFMDGTLLARAIAKSIDGKYVLIKYVDYDYREPKDAPTVYALISPRKIRPYKGYKTIVTHKGGNDFDAYAEVKNGRLVTFEYYTPEAKKHLQQAVDRGLVK